jgi:hypothetical protein
MVSDDVSLRGGAATGQPIHGLSPRTRAADSSELTLLRVSGSSSHDMLGYFK